MRQTLVIGFFLWVCALKGQEVLLPLDVYTSWKTERTMSDSAVLVHPEVKPYTTWTHQRYAGSENDAINVYHSLALFRKNNSFFRISPRVNATGFIETGTRSQRGVESYIGAAIGAGFRNKVYLGADVLAGYTEPAFYIQKIIDSLRVVPGYSRASRQGGYGFHQSTITLAWKPSKHIELMAGRGKHFIGEGYRSLFLSDFAPNYNYLRADLSVWKIKYMVLYTQMRQPQGYPNAFYPLINKYSTMHYLSLNITKWWSVGAFEAVVWESEDSVMNREFDVNYLNPIIFFRPIEYSLGSSDNSLLGFSTTFRPLKGLTLYSQVMLDEFLFNEVTASLRKRLSGDSTIATGWWANKQAFQAGAKYHELFGWKNSTVLGEFNFVRPFTYGHSNTAQSYTHLNHPLAHPLGANFIEWVAMAVWQPNRWNFGLRMTYARKGYSNSLGFLGEDPLVSNGERDKDNREHGNTMLQGRLEDVANLRLETGYTLVPAWNLRAEAALHLRTLRTESVSSVSSFFVLGLRTALWNDYKDL